MKKVEKLTRDELVLFVESLHAMMYRERDNEAEEGLENAVVIRLNPDKEVNGGDLVDLVNDWFHRLGVHPDSPEVDSKRSACCFCHASGFEPVRSGRSHTRPNG